MEYALLLGFYSSLLTQRQQDWMDLYYNQDYSLSEIAENARVSRQAVMDAVKRGENTLRNLEKQLGMAARYRKISAGLEECLRLNEEENREALGEKLREMITEWEDNDGV